MNRRICIGIAFDTKADYGIPEDDLRYCDFSYVKEIETIKKELELSGYETILINPPERIVDFIEIRQFDIVFNTTEGFKSRNREILIPIICETYKIPYIGTDAFGLALTNHKYHTKLVVEQAGILTPSYYCFDPTITSYAAFEDYFTKNESLFPVILKPNREGSSMGIVKIDNVRELIVKAQELYSIYNQELLVEQYIAGADILSFVIGTSEKTQAYPLVEVRNEKGKHYDIWGTEEKMEGSLYQEASIPSSTQEFIQQQSILIHNLFKLRDISRSDWRVNQDGQAYFLESTPLPSYDFNGSFDCCANLSNLSFRSLLLKVITSALERENLLPK